MRIRLAQPIALHIEFFLSNGLSKRQLMNMIDRGDFTKLHSLQHKFLKVENFIEFANQHGYEVKEALINGYEVKFTTLKGLVNMITFKYKLKEDRDFHIEPNEVNQVPLSKAEADDLQRIIASTWQVVNSETSPPRYRITLKNMIAE